MTTEKEHADTQCASKKALGGLAREVEGLRQLSEPIPQRLDDLAKVVDGLAEAAAKRAGGKKVVAPSLFNLPDDVDLVAELIDELCGWLGTVFLRYPDAAAVLPDCWLWHPEVVEELVWLMHTWIAAYADDAASAVAAGDWHDRYRPGVVKRIKQAAGTCSLETHADPKPAPRVPLVEAAEAIVTWWATARAQAAPVPDEAHLAAAEPARWGARR